MMLYCNAWVLTTALIWPRLPQYNTQQHTLVIIDRSLVGGQNSTATTVLAQSLKRKTSRFLILNLVNPPWLNRLHRIRNYKSLRCACKKVVLKISRFVSVTESSHWTFLILPFFYSLTSNKSPNKCVCFLLFVYFFLPMYINVWCDANLNAISQWCASVHRDFKNIIIRYNTWQ